MTTDNKQHATVPIQALLSRKLDMTQAWDANGRLAPLTAVQVGTNVVTQVRTEEVDGYNVVQLGFGEIPARKVTKPMAGHFAETGVEPRRHLARVCTSATDNYELGQELQATVFKAGQAIDVSGNIKDKGFAGVIKRHGFAGVSTSHGAYRNHRKSGSTGACTTPGRISKGLRIVGRMRSIRRTVQNLRIQAVDAEKGLLLINGATSGPRSGVVLVRSSVRGA